MSSERIDRFPRLVARAEWTLGGARIKFPSGLSALGLMEAWLEAVVLGCFVYQQGTIFHGRTEPLGWRH